MEKDDNTPFTDLKDSHEGVVENSDSSDSDAILASEKADTRSMVVSIVTIIASLVIGVIGVLVYYNIKSDPESVSLSDSYPIAYNSELASDGSSFAPVSFVDNQAQHAFIFSNNSEILATTKIVEIYITFDGVKSLELLLSNYYALEEEISYNDMALVLHVIDSDTVVSDRIISALSHSFATSPKASWDYLGELTIISQLNLENDLSEESIENRIIDSAKKLGISTVSRENIKGNSFNEWLYEYNDEKISKIGSFVPTIVVNGKTLTTDNNVNDPESLISEIRKL